MKPPAMKPLNPDLADHRPFYVKCAGLGSGALEKLAAYGGNSFRRWRTGGRRRLERVIARKIRLDIVKLETEIPISATKLKTLLPVR